MASTVSEAMAAQPPGVNSQMLALSQTIWSKDFEGEPLMTVKDEGNGSFLERTNVAVLLFVRDKLSGEASFTSVLAGMFTSITCCILKM